MLSYARGPDAPILEITIHEAFADAVRLYPDHGALVVPHQGVRLTHRELHEQVERTARGLAGLGLGPRIRRQEIAKVKIA